MAGNDRQWQYLAERLGGQYGNGMAGGEKVTATVEGWTLVLDRYRPNLWSTLTRLRCRYPSADGFRFSIYPASFDLASTARKAFGWIPMVKTEVPYFDAKFIVEANDVQKVRTLLSDPVLREQLSELNHFRVETGYGQPVAAGTLELTLLLKGNIEEIARLQYLFGLCANLLGRLAAIGSATPTPESEPENPPA